ncbi:MAG: nuclease-related domain-containing protein [Pseudomonadota bacterium]
MRSPIDPGNVAPVLVRLTIMLDNLLHASLTPLVLAGALALALLLAGLGAVMIFRHRRDPRTAARRVQVMLRASGLPHVRDVVIPDYVGGYTQVDHLLLTPGGIVLLEWQHFDGIVHGTAHTLNWSRFEGGRRHDFDNPFRRLQTLAETLAALVPGTPIQLRLVVSGPVRFPRGLPEGVLTLAGLGDYLAARAGSIPADQLERWHALLSRVACDPVAPFGARPPAPAVAPGITTPA